MIETARENHVSSLFIVGHRGIGASRRNRTIDRHTLPANSVILPGFVEKVLRIIAFQVTTEEDGDIPVRVISQRMTRPISWGPDIAAEDPLIAGLCE
jgi:hypothetical protein